MKKTELITFLLLLALIPCAALATDSDSDGWDDAIDVYPLHRVVNQPVTNVLLQHGYDAESNTEQWQKFTHATIDGITEIKETIGHDGNTTHAFHIKATADEARKKFGFDGPTLTMFQGKEVSHVRLSAWIKVEGPDGATPPLSSLGVSYIAAPYRHPFSGELITHSGITQSFSKEQYYNQGWIYSEFDFELNAPATSLNIFIEHEQKAGSEFWVDDIELNFISHRDSDGDELIDALDSDDDNDNILDGDDDTPLGELSVDLDEDGIIDGYDDDLDNDGLVNALDDTLDYIELTSDSVEGIITVTAAVLWPTDTVINYMWSLDGVGIAAQGNSININKSDYPPSTILNVTLTTTGADEVNTISHHKIMITTDTVSTNYLQPTERETSGGGSIILTFLTALLILRRK